MAKEVKFRLKEEKDQDIKVLKEDVREIVPDADFRFSLLILKDGSKHFICGTKQEVEEKLGE